MKTTSTFAASTCSSAACQAVLRENFVRRGRTAWIVAAPARRGAGATATQSPTAGRSAGEVGLVRRGGRRRRAELAELREDDVGAAVLHGDAAGDEAVGGVGLELLGEGVVPAERGEVGQAEISSRTTERRTRIGAPVARGPSRWFSRRAARGAARRKRYRSSGDLLRRGHGQYARPGPGRRVPLRASAGAARRAGATRGRKFAPPRRS